MTVLYVNTTPGGLRLIGGLRRMGIVSGEPAQVADAGFAFMDRESSRYWQDEFDAYRGAGNAYAEIKGLIDPIVSGLGQRLQAMGAANVVKRWADELSALLHLTHHSAAVAAVEHGVRLSQVFVVAPAVTPASANGRAANGQPTVIRQSSMRNAVLYGVGALALAFGRVLRALVPGRAARDREACIGVTAAWGARPGRANDLFWWWKSGIAPARLLYLIDAEHHPPHSVDDARACGLRVAALRPARRMPLSLLAKTRPTLADALGDLKLVASLTARSWVTTGTVRAGLALLAWHHVMARRLAAQLTMGGVRALFHYQESYSDYYGYAAELANGARIGMAWSSLAAPCSVAIRTHHAFFCWGAYDGALCLDAGATTEHVLIAGCPIVEMRSNEAYRVAARTAADRIRRAGARVVLTLFDTTFNPDFYRAFLAWTVECQSVGLLIKSRDAGWRQTHADGLEGLVERALATGRVIALPEDTSPADAAAPADFAVGCISPSAVIVSAFAGSRVLYVDYERFDQGPLRPYAALHSLGPNRCVFYDADSLQAAVERYVADPAVNQLLGDITPVLDQLDPFRDGQTSIRIGDYVRWYLEALDDGLGRDMALRSATRQYADKWGPDKVVRGLE